MSSIYDSRQRWKLGFIFAAVLIAMASVVVSDLLIKDLAREERQKIEVWSEATRVMTSENPSLNMNLILKSSKGILLFLLYYAVRRIAWFLIII